MQLLLETGLYFNPGKCEFHKETVRYMGLIISTMGIPIDEDIIESIRNWSREKKTKNRRLNNLFDVQQFYGFCNYSRWFIPKYSEKPEPLTRLMRKEEWFLWESKQQLAFETIITAFTITPAFRHFDHEKEVIIERDASDYVSAGVFSQRDDEGVLHPMALFSKKNTPAESIYDIYDKELMAMIKAPEEWRPECDGAAYPLHLITDHTNLEYCITKKLLNRRQSRWSEFLTHFNYEIVYRPGKSNGKADALTRRPGDLPKVRDERLKNMEQVVLKAQNVLKELCLMVNSPPAQGRPSISNLMTEGYEMDPLSGEISESIGSNSSLKEITIIECTDYNGKFSIEGSVMMWKVISYGYDWYRNIMIAHLRDTQAGWRLLTFWTGSITGRICGDRWISMYGIGIAVNGLGALNTWRSGSFAHYQFPRSRGRISQ